LAPFLLAYMTMNSIRLGIGRVSSRAGFSLAELSVVLAVIGALFSLALPSVLNYYQTAAVRGAASDVAAYMNQARQLAIQLNCSVSVQINPTTITYTRQANCQTPGIWTGPGTDAGGNIPAPDGITLATTATPIFTNLGAAAPAATLTVTHGTSNLSVLVSASGRVTVAP
jgi:prepilin-type N-terminal cleavage/methylation domain-containing protein